MAKEERAHFEIDNIVWQQPPDDIVCRDCAYRKPDVKSGDRVLVKGYKNAKCAAYVEQDKPLEVLFEKKDCEWYEKDDLGTVDHLAQYVSLQDKPAD